MKSKILYVLLRIVMHIHSCIVIFWTALWVSVFFLILAYLVQKLLNINLALPLWIIWFVWGSFCLTLIVQLHLFLWYDKRFPAKMECPTCHQEVSLSSEPQEDKESTGTRQALRRFVSQMYRVIFHCIKIAHCRPRLYLYCPNCGEQKVVCPYCKQEIDTKVGKCPHCGKIIEDMTISYTH